ncbi:hypothetical protein DFJ77DRAFT_512771 [Powellomyces hirtus]|nr:hypothetical protein DFJ77DRAFT_512771 [Powellomyces hirtus]
MTVVHIVHFKVKAAAQVAEFEEQVRTLAGIKGVQRFSFGRTFTTDRAKGYTHAMVMDFADKEALERYSSDEHHVHVINTYIKPNIEEGGVLCLDIEQ